MKQYRTLLLALLAVLALTVCALADGEEGDRVYVEIDPFAPVEPYTPIYPTASDSRSGNGMLRNSGSVSADLLTYLKTQLYNYTATIDLTGYSLTADDLKQAMTLVSYSHDPDMFFVKGDYSYSFSGSTVMSVTPTYQLVSSKNDIDTKKAEFDNMVKEIVDLVNANASTPVQKVLYLNDYLATHYYYDLRLFDANGNTIENGPENHDAYSMLRDGYGVCESYATVTMAVLNRLGDSNIQCTWATSKTLNHAWNAVKIGENWYQLDVTWNDPLIGSADGAFEGGNKNFDYLGYAGHNYFLLSDGVMNDSSHHDCSDAVFGEGLTRDSFTNTEYDDYFWTNAESAFVRVKDVSYEGWYYISESKIYKWDGTSSEGGSALLEVGGGQSSTYNSWYINKHNANIYREKHIGRPGLNYLDGILYFNTWDDIVSYDLGTKDLQLLGTVYGTTNDIHGCVIKGDDIRYVVEDNSVYGTRTIADALISYTPGPDGGGYSYRLDGSKLYLKLNTGAKVIVACYTSGKMTSVQVVTASTATVTLSGDDWAVFSVDANYAPLCGALRKASAVTAP